MKMKKFRSVVIAAALAAIVLSACGGSSAPAPTATPAGPKVSAEAQKYVALKGVVANGQKQFQNACTSCHGPDAKGMPSLGKDLTTSTFLKGLPDAEAVLFLAKGRPASDPLNTTKVDMPPKGGNPALKDQDLADIIAYVRTLQ
jgi:mono/diheme cytochrome c family protein